MKSVTFRQTQARGGWELLCPGRTGGYLQMNRSSLRNNRLWKLETSGELPIVLEESIEEYISNE